LKAEEKKQSEARKWQINELAKECGITSPFQCYEVSCHTLDNIDELKDVIIANALSHSYMGERVPKSYLDVENILKSLQKDHQNEKESSNQIVLPISNLKPFTNYIPDFVQRALSLLSQWGECIYFSEPVELSFTVIIEPSFLTKEVLEITFQS